MQLNPMCLNGQVSFMFSEKWAPSSVNVHYKGVFFSFYLSLVLFRYWQRKVLSLILSSWNLVFQPRLQHCKVEVMLHVCFWRRLCCWFPKFVIDWVIGNPLGYRCQHSAVFRSQFRVKLEGLGFSAPNFALRWWCLLSEQLVETSVALAREFLVIEMKSWMAVCFCFAFFFFHSKFRVFKIISAQHSSNNGKN